MCGLFSDVAMRVKSTASKESEACRAENYNLENRVCSFVQCAESAEFPTICVILDPLSSKKCLVGLRRLKPSPKAGFLAWKFVAVFFSPLAELCRTCTCFFTALVLFVMLSLL